MSTWAVVPVKGGSGKQRLAPVLTDAARTQLIGAMLAQVLEAIAGAGVTGILVISPEPLPLPAAVRALHDPGRGLNEALGLALPQLTRLAATRALIVSADLPWLESADVRALLEAPARGIALAPDHSGTGTNALALGLPSDFRPQFGAASRRCHEREALRLGQPLALIERAGLARDVDEPQDLAALRAARAPRYAFL